MRHMPPNSIILCDLPVFLTPPQKDVEMKQVLKITPDEDVEEAPALVWDGKALVTVLQHISLL